MKNYSDVSEQSSENLLDIDASIRKEADEIIYSKGLHNILSEFGLAFYTGSYSLHLMTWRDLDIYLETENISEKRFCANRFPVRPAWNCVYDRSLTCFGSARHTCR